MEAAHASRKLAALTAIIQTMLLEHYWEQALDASAKATVEERASAPQRALLTCGGEQHLE